MGVIGRVLRANGEKFGVADVFDDVGGYVAAEVSFAAQYLDERLCAVNSPLHLDGDTATQYEAYPSSQNGEIESLDCVWPEGGY